MSDHRAIPAVTHTLRLLLTGAASTAVPGASVTVGPPGVVGAGARDQPRINLFLYVTSPNAAWRTTDVVTGWPSDPTQGGAVHRRVVLPLTLHYLMSFHGDEAGLVPQRLLGIGAALVQSTPVLTADTVTKALATAPDLIGCGLDDDITETEPIRVTRTDLVMEDLSRLWMMFPQVPYALCMTFQAQVALLAPVVGDPAQLIGTRSINIRPGTPVDLRQWRRDQKIPVDPA